MCKMTKLVVLLLALASAGTLAAELPETDGKRHMGVATCATSQCHGSAVPRGGSNVMQSEYVTWTQDDPHSRAWETLSSEASRAMANRLGLADAQKADVCLDCHADNVATNRRGEKFHLSDGVGCESCHGGAENWLSSHYNTPEVGHAENVSAGLYPNANAKDRADLCLSCHLGTKNKFASHRIMAAGHPRLSFELDTFTELWRTAGRQPHYRADADYVDRKGRLGHADLWATGLLADARRRLQLIQDDGFSGGSMFPELGLYDCHACHRSMKSVQWRRLPRHGNAEPGMPFLTDGTFVMALALARSVAPGEAEGLSKALTRLHVASSENVVITRSAAAELDVIIRRMQSRLVGAGTKGRELEILREVLATGAEGNYLDYASAEQAFMAVQMLIFEIGDQSLEDELDALGDALQDDQRYRPSQFARLLASIGESEDPQ